MSIKLIIGDIQKARKAGLTLKQCSEIFGYSLYSIKNALEREITHAPVTAPNADIRYIAKPRKCLWCGEEIVDSQWSGDRYHNDCRQKARHGEDVSAPETTYEVRITR